MLLLGRWQWHVAQAHHGDIRYYAYALQWWAFVGFACLMWYRIVTDSVRRRSAQPTPDQPGGSDAPLEQPRVSRYLAYQPPQPAADPDPDPERARFNAYLAQLDAADRAA